MLKKIASSPSILDSIPRLASSTSEGHSVQEPRMTLESWSVHRNVPTKTLPSLRTILMFRLSQL